MKSRIYLFVMILVLASLPVYAQLKNNYPHCNCIETIPYTADSTKLDGTYSLVCNNVTIVTGQYINGVRNGKWITQTDKGVVIKTAVYDNGKLNGKYELFHFNGVAKLTANFVNGLQEGLWQYLNDKGKVIKTGNFKSGAPVGVWTIYDKSGKTLLANYDFSKNAASNSQVPAYFKSGNVAQDNQSGEWYISYYPERNPQSDIQPLGGYALANDYFMLYMSVPAVMMNTYVHFEYTVQLQVENNVVKTVSTQESDSKIYAADKPALPFIVTTNSPAKLKHVTFAKSTTEIFQTDIAETVLLAGPWIGTGTVDLQVPFVLNDIKKY